VVTLDLAIGMMQFLFPEAGPETNTRDLFCSASQVLFSGIQGGLYIGYDIGELRDIHASFTLSYNMPTEAPAVALSISGGYAGNRIAVGNRAGTHEYAATCKG
jgi:hypothetical protein